MKKLIAIIAAAITAGGAFAQGTITFSNFQGPIDAPVTGLDGTGLAGGGQYLVTLYAGESNDSTSMQAAFDQPLTFNGAGYFIRGEQVVNGFGTGTTPFIQVRAWDSTTGSDWASATIRGESNIIQLSSPGLGGGGLPPPIMAGLESFQLVPEPSTVALGALGAVALAFLGRRRK